MSWEYRVVRSKIDGSYGIRECYDKTASWTMNNVYPVGDNLDELKKDLERMLSACDKPVLVEHKDKLMQEVR